MVHTSHLKRLLPSTPPQFIGLNLEDLLLFHSLHSHISMTQSFWSCHWRDWRKHIGECLLSSESREVAVWCGYRWTSYASEIDIQIWNFCLFLGAFAKKLWKVTISPRHLISVCLHGTDFCEISYLGFLLKFVDTLCFWFKLIKSNGLFCTKAVVHLYITTVDLYNWDIFLCDLQAEAKEAVD
jgi:hypothetical protein